MFGLGSGRVGITAKMLLTFVAIRQGLGEEGNPGGVRLGPGRVGGGYSDEALWCLCGGSLKTILSARIEDASFTESCSHDARSEAASLYDCSAKPPSLFHFHLASPASNIGLIGPLIKYIYHYIYH